MRHRLCEFGQAARDILPGQAGVEHGAFNKARALVPGTHPEY
jgi:hypothetical protein